MSIIRTFAAYLLGVAVTYVFAAVFYTQQVIAKQQAIGAVYTPEQSLSFLMENLYGLGFRDVPSLGITIAVALAIGFAVAFVLKRILKPLAPIAYPIAGAAAVIALITWIESTAAGGGAGAIGGARGAMGLALQGLAGFLGGTAFAFVRPR